MLRAMLIALALVATPALAQTPTPTPTPTPAPETPAAAPATPDVPPPAAPVAAPVPAPVLPVIDPNNLLVLELSNGGKVTIAMRPDKAPQHVERIRTLTRQKFYDGVIFHRVIEGFMAQTGDRSGTGREGSKLPNLKAEFNDLPHLRGTAAMARTDDKNSANSQWFICFMPAMHLDGTYTVWGRVIDGMDAVDQIERGEPPANPTKIVRAYIAADRK